MDGRGTIRKPFSDRSKRPQDRFDVPSMKKKHMKTMKKRKYLENMNILAQAVLQNKPCPKALAYFAKPWSHNFELFCKTAISTGGEGRRDC